MLLGKAKGIRVGSKGRRLKNEIGSGGAGGRAQRLPPQCGPRKVVVVVVGGGGGVVVVVVAGVVVVVVAEGSLEVKLPTIWTDEKQSRAEAER